ncbi:MAG TPA: signal peptidase I [Thermoanaerobaculia bacterium]|nr:signal peptidase I [Thermoanaerobaculia bacterium]
MDDSRTEFPPEPQARLASGRMADERRKTADQARGSISTGRWMWEWTKAISTAILLFLVIRTFVVEAFKIPTGSMENTLLVGDFLLVNKAVYGAELPVTHTRLPAFKVPHRGDVVVFLPPHDPHKNYVKRLVGVAGDTLEMRDKTLYRNGVPQDEPFVRHSDPLTDPPDPRMRWQLSFLVPGTFDWRTYRPTRDNWGPLVVPPGKYFALGDNRDDSEDSRYWGFLDTRAIKGRPILVYYSFKRDIAEPFSWITGVRWSRIGELIH